MVIWLLIDAMRSCDHAIMRSCDHAIAYQLDRLPARSPGIPVGYGLAISLRWCGRVGRPPNMSLMVPVMSLHIILHSRRAFPQFQSNYPIAEHSLSFTPIIRSHKIPHYDPPTPYRFLPDAHLVFI